MSEVIGILEDDDTRAKNLAMAFASLVPSARLERRDNAPGFIAWLDQAFDSVKLLSLDHDLFLCLNVPEPGTGMVVVEFLLSRPARFPVLVHSANPQGGPEMARRLREAGWTTAWTGELPESGEIDWSTRVRRALGL